MFKEGLPANNEISPNYINNHSIHAEIGIDKIIDEAKELGVETEEPNFTAEAILSIAKQKIPERYNLVLEKLQKENKQISNLPKNVLMDRLLGVDSMFKFKDKVFAVDVTSGKHTVVKNKQKKFEALEEVLKEIGIDNTLIIRLKQDISDNVILDIFSKLESSILEEKNNFCEIMRYPETKKKPRKRY